MGIENRKPLDQATQEIPEKWYESRPTRVITAASTTIANFMVYDSLRPYKEALDDHPILSAVVGAALYGVGSFVDNRSTEKLLATGKKLREAGEDIVLIEQNPLLQEHYTSVKEFKNDKKKKAQDIAGTALSAVTPFIAPGLAVGKGLAALGNRNLEKRLDRATEIALSQKD